jgi:hypothetical protein
MLDSALGVMHSPLALISVEVACTGGDRLLALVAGAGVFIAHDAHQLEPDNVTARYQAQPSRNVPDLQ